MQDSICWFLCSASAMRVWGHSKPISMLVHTSQKQQHHKQVSDAIRSWISTIDRNILISKCKSIWMTERDILTIDSFRETYPEYGRTNEELNDYPEFTEIVSHIEVLLEEITHIPLGEDSEFQYHAGIHLCVDNCANNGITEEGMFVRLAYPDPEKVQPKPAPVFIIVGGSTLSRGLTIEGLVSTYFLRSTCQADSLMQMGRWFGYRRGYELLPRIWMTQDTIDKFKFLAALEMELRQDLVRYMIAAVDPKEYGPRVKNTPKASWLRITAKNRMQSAKEIEMDFTGTSSETFLFDNDAQKLKKNIDITETFIDSLGRYKFKKNSSFIWEGVEFSKIYDKLLQPFEFNQNSRTFKKPALEMFADWVKNVSIHEKLQAWNIIVAGLGNSENEEWQWKIANGSVGKVNRSRKMGVDDSVINIGVLRDPKDLLADVQIDMLSKETREKLAISKSTIDIEQIRSEAGLGRTPQLIIYRISKDSTARENNSSNRVNLNAVEDIIGLCIVIPGGKSRGVKSQALTIKLNRKVNEVWREEE
nr:Z1 domain-containing protein [Paenibacillus lignilyticus]